MRRVFRLVLIPVIISLMAGCLPGSPASVSQKAIRSDQPRTESGQVSQDDATTLARGNNTFALDLYQRLRTDGEELFYSPYSISLALAMTYAGARGETARQMAETLHFTLPTERLHPAFNALDQELASRKDMAGQGADGKGFRLNVTNDIWGQEGMTFQQEFLDLLAMNYGSGLRQLNFKDDPESARKTINDYIAQKTEKRIQDLLPQGILNKMTRLVLTNAIYFNSAWLYPFDKGQTRTAPFTRLDRTQVDVALMRQSMHQNLAYAAGDGYQAVALPYEKRDLSMLLLVPDAGRFAEFEAGLDAARLESILGQMEVTSTLVSMPSFQTEAKFSLKEALSAMGMAEPFDRNRADFSGMDGTRTLYISEVVHKAFVKVDEEGTEAAAATAAVINAASMPAQMVELVIDRPFIYIIRDAPTNTILFIGTVLDPAR